MKFKNCAFLCPDCNRYIWNSIENGCSSCFWALQDIVNLNNMYLHANILIKEEDSDKFKQEFLEDNYKKFCIFTTQLQADGSVMFNLNLINIKGSKALGVARYIRENFVKYMKSGSALIIGSQYMFWKLVQYIGTKPQIEELIGKEALESILSRCYNIPLHDIPEALGQIHALLMRRLETGKK